jgi:hypothetical protein
MPHEGGIEACCGSRERGRVKTVVRQRDWLAISIERWCNRGSGDPAIAAYCQQLADEAPPLSERQKDIIAAAFAGALARAKVADG